MASTRAQRADRREAVLRSAMEVMAAQGIAGSRLADIASRAGISPGQVLYYFESKADLFIQALQTLERELRADVLAHAVQPSFAERFEYLLQAAAPRGPGDFKLLLWMEAWELAARDKHVAAQLQEIEDQWLDTLRRIIAYGVETGELHVDDLDSFALRLTALMDGLTIQVVNGSPHINRETWLAICRDAVRNGLGGTQARARARRQSTTLNRAGHSPSTTFSATESAGT